LDAYEKLREMDPRNKEVAARVERLKDRLGVFELPSLYNSIPASNAITREDLAALIAVKFKGVLDDSQVKPPIIIDISTSWASKFILKTASLDLLEVYDNHTFLPKKAINRAEFAEAMLRLVDFLSKKGYRFVPQVSPERIQISDVPPDSFFYRPITRIVAYQIMDLTPQRTFQPEAPVSGQEAGRTLDIVLALIK
ncbi:MAG TPA: S-layer homology domain-containing protein, partial [Candidatus Aminicenantes bacterium]|nr:S-layer homology domain-containing protein [Candidatus Aminicenantes bacterium]